MDTASRSAAAVSRQVAGLARDASLELNPLEVAELSSARDVLWPGQRLYVSHLPRQTWVQTLDACALVARLGFEPVPHIPVRLLESEAQLHDVLGGARRAGAREPLLISGDYATSRGPFEDVLSVLRSGVLQDHGFTQVSIAGHPEGHPAVPEPVIRRAQIDKARLAAAAQLRVTLVTQFFFEAEPFLTWARDLRAAGVQARLVAGLPGPAGIAKLLRLARHCGVGASIRALTSRPANLLRLLGDHRPDGLVRALALARKRQPSCCDGIHVFSFGGLLRTARWLRELADDAPAGAEAGACRVPGE